jgi:hypothetical protein
MTSLPNSQWSDDVDNNIVFCQGHTILTNQLGCAVRFRFEAKRCENEAKNFLHRSEKIQFFRLFRFEAKNWKSQVKRKRTKRKKQSETKKNRKIKNVKMT